MELRRGAKGKEISIVVVVVIGCFMCRIYEKMKELMMVVMEMHRELSHRSSNLLLVSHRNWVPLDFR